MNKIILKGITWGHSRGITPLLAASQRYNELHPDVEIIWNKRTLQQFADYPIEQLTKEYDLLIIDHPWVGCADATNCVLPLNDFLSDEYLYEQAENSVGHSHHSYLYNNKQWALAIDAATPVVSYRKDLFEKNNTSLPSTWDELLLLAKDGKVLLPGIAIDTLMAFYMFCIAHGKEPFCDEHNREVIDEETGLMALQSMNTIWQLCHKKIFDCNPILVAETMATSDEYWYCPFAFGYSNYSRNGYAHKLLTYSDTIHFGHSGKLKTTLGGTGLSVSAFSKHKQQAVEFAQWVCSPKIQSTLYVQNGGQPGHRSAWLNEEANSLCGNFFFNTLDTLDRAYVRPRYNGYLHFQDTAGEPLRNYLLNGGNPKSVLSEINKIYQHSLTNE